MTLSILIVFSIGKSALTKNELLFRVRLGLKVRILDYSLRTCQRRLISLLNKCYQSVQSKLPITCFWSVYARILLGPFYLAIALWVIESSLVHLYEICFSNSCVIVPIKLAPYLYAVLDRTFELVDCFFIIFCRLAFGFVSWQMGQFWFILAAIIILSVFMACSFLYR